MLRNRHDENIGKNWQKNKILCISHVTKMPIENFTIFTLIFLFNLQFFFISFCFVFFAIPILSVRRFLGAWALLYFYGIHYLHSIWLVSVICVYGWFHTWVLIWECLLIHSRNEACYFFFTLLKITIKCERLSHLT